MVKIFLKSGPWEDAVRIELHIATITVNRECLVREEYLPRLRQLEKEGIIIIR